MEQVADNSRVEALNPAQEQALNQARKHPWSRFPEALEPRYQQQARERASQLIYRSIYLLIGIYLVVVVPLLLLADQAELSEWPRYGVYPIAVALAALWLATRLPLLKQHVITIMGLALMISLSATLLGAFRLQGSFASQVCAFEAIYILIIGFSILRMPATLTLLWSLAGGAVALLACLWSGITPAPLALLLYYLVPLFICALTGYLLDSSARNSFASHLLLAQESQRLSRLRQDAEQARERQLTLNHFREQIAGNLSAEQLLQRVLRFLIVHSEADIGAAWQVKGHPEQQLVRLASWGLNQQAEQRQTLALTEGLPGAALVDGKIRQHQHVPEGYMDIETGHYRFVPRCLLFWPLLDINGQHGVIELASSGTFSADTETLLEGLQQPLCDALRAAQQRTKEQG